ncbi:Os02g0206550, partial [Oryza sativa Japonica Group]
MHDGVEVAERVEARRPVEEEPRDADPPGNSGGPRVAPVGDDAARAPLQSAHVGLEGRVEGAHGDEKGRELRVLRELVGVLAVRRQACHGRRERELHDLEGQLLARGLVSDAAQPRGVQRRRDEAGACAMRGEEAREIDHGDDVTVRRERGEDEVRLRRRRLCCGLSCHR